MSEDRTGGAGGRPGAQNRHQNGSLELLEHIIEVTSADLDVNEVSQRVAGLVTAATKSDVCFVHLVDEELRRVVLAGATPPFDEQVGIVQLAIGEGIAGWVAKHGEPAVVPDKWKDRRYRYIPELRGEDFTSMVSVPMLVRGRVVGVLNVHSKAARNYGDGDLALLTQVANLMARAIENARLYRRLAEREEMLERFATSTVEAQELERRRLAGEIHDGISQRLVSLWYHLLAAEDALSGGAPPDGLAAPDRVRRELATAKELATAALDEARAAIAGLRPFVLDDLGLGPGLESLARSLSGLEVEVDVEPVDLPSHVEVALYRIAQEALQNVVKHADASAVLIHLSAVDDGARLVVSDDGRGFDEDVLDGAEERHAYGLVGIRERAELIGASLSVVSRPGTGTTLELVVPGESRQKV
ncbi:MAG TPA: GAF domain-containing sensor histidine kinase [Acidimicrobiales bacterium]|nr:GAF domain-containing sensor histidine kinase [Acidimicrobiales bacterium]